MSEDLKKAAKFTVQTIDKFDKLTVLNKGTSHAAQFWNSAQFANTIEVGGEYDIEYKSEEYQGRTNRIIQSVNGVPATKPRAGFGGGGGGSYKPKSQEEIHGASICGIIKSCLEAGKTPEDAEDWFRVYWSQIEKVKA